MFSIGLGLWRRFLCLKPIRPLTTELICIFILVLILQTIGQFRSFSNDFLIYNGKNSEERDIAFFGLPYKKFIKDCKIYLPDEHNAEFLTDIQNKRQVLQQVLGYHLYPIDIFYIRPAPRDCIILLATKTHHLKLPDGFQILTQTEINYGNKDYILLAAKKIP